MSTGSLRRFALTMLAVGAAVWACGSSSASPTSPTSPTTPPSIPTVGVKSAPTPTPGTPDGVTTTVAPVGCPTAATINAALGTSLPAPIGIASGGGMKLPAGATGMACEYHGATSNVIIELISNTDPSSISLFSSQYPVPFKNVPGVGDQARSFSQPLGGGKDNEGVVATKGTTLVAISATGTPASLAQVEALVSQLL